jgi:hypothetical protein
VKRLEFHIFDSVFKRVMECSPPAVVSLVNGLAGSTHPRDSAIIHENRESITRGLRRRSADVILRIGDSLYNMEAEIRPNDRVFPRIVDYAWPPTRSSVSVAANGGLAYEFPRLVVLFWEGGGEDRSIPFSFGATTIDSRHGVGSYTDSIAVWCLSSHTPREIASMGMHLLLPYCVLAPRRGVNARSVKPETYEEAAESLKAILDEIYEALKDGVESGVITDDDERVLLELTATMYDYIYGELYEKYNGFKEMFVKQNERLVTRIDRIKSQYEEKQSQYEEDKKKLVTRIDAMQQEKLELQRQMQEMTDRLRATLLEQGLSEDSILAVLERIITPVDNA